MSSTSRTWPGARLRATAAALAITGTMVIAGCGGGSTPAPVSSAAAPSSVAASIPAAGSAGTGAGDGTCGEATAALVKQQLTQAGIVSITTEGGCHDVTIVTTLAAADVAEALAICDAAAAIAYPAGDISSITVTGANDKELSIGIRASSASASRDRLTLEALRLGHFSRNAGEAAQDPSRPTGWRAPRSCAGAQRGRIAGAWWP